MLAWQGSEVQKIGAIFEVTLQPTASMNNFSDATLILVAKALKSINEKGVPVLLRYGHEMNGDWTSYGVHPVQYVTGFQRMANTIKKYTNLTGLSQI